MNDCVVPASGRSGVHPLKVFVAASKVMLGSNVDPAVIVGASPLGALVAAANVNGVPTVADTAVWVKVRSAKT